MRDSWGLLLVALMASLAAWCFWHYLGADAMNVMAALVIILLAADNARLRRAMARRSHLSDKSRR